RTVASIGNRSRAGGRGRRVFRASDGGMLRKDLPPHAAGGISLFHLRGDTVAVEDDPLGETTRFRLDAPSVRAGGFTVKKHPIAIKIFLLVVLSVVVAIVY